MFTAFRSLTITAKDKNVNRCRCLRCFFIILRIDGEYQQLRQEKFSENEKQAKEASETLSMLCNTKLSLIFENRLVLHSHDHCESYDCESYPRDLSHWQCCSLTNVFALSCSTNCQNLMRIIHFVEGQTIGDGWVYCVKIFIRLDKISRFCSECRSLHTNLCNAVHEQDWSMILT